MKKILACGLCFPFAVEKAVAWIKRHPEERDNTDAFRVVHGWVTDKFQLDAYPVVHAWVEVGDKVFDEQTSHLRPDGLTHELYYDLYQPEPVAIYSAMDVIRYCHLTRTEGPWEEELIAALEKRDAWLYENPDDGDDDSFTLMGIRRNPAEERPLIFLDLDETLVHVGHRTLVRPNAEEFIEELSEFADVYLYTAAEPWYMVEVLQTTGLESYLDNFYSLQEQNDFSPLRLDDRKWLLVDNLGYDRHLTHSKLEATGAAYDEDNFIQVADFTGGNDTVFIDGDLMLDIKNRLRQPTGNCYYTWDEARDHPAGHIDELKSHQTTPTGKGWTPAPHSHKGGYRRKVGHGWEYWYPTPHTVWYHGASTDAERAHREQSKSFYLTKDQQFAAGCGDVHVVKLANAGVVFDTADEKQSKRVAERFFEQAREGSLPFLDLDRMAAQYKEDHEDDPVGALAEDLSPDHIRDESTYDSGEIQGWLYDEFGFEAVHFYDEDTALVLDPSHVEKLKKTKLGDFWPRCW